MSQKHQECKECRECNPLCIHTKKSNMSNLTHKHQVFFNYQAFLDTLRCPTIYNQFLQNLISAVPHPFDVSDVSALIALYKIGTAPNSATCLPFINSKGDICAIQEVLFDVHNNVVVEAWQHLRLSAEYGSQNLPEWLRAYNSRKQPNCLFGEHLLSKYPHNPVALVETPLQAIYGTLYAGLPVHSDNLVWMATGVSNEDTEGYIDTVLAGRRVCATPLEVCGLLPPDGEAFDGFIIKKDWRMYRTMYDGMVTSQPVKPKAILSPVIEPVNLEWIQTRVNQQNIPFDETLLPEITECWMDEIQELATFFNSVSLPTTPVRISDGVRIVDIRKHIHSHLAIVKAQNGKKAYLRYMERLRLLYTMLR